MTAFFLRQTIHSPLRFPLIFLSSPRGETPHMEGVGMLVVSLRGVNFAFWSHLGCFEQNTITFSREGLV